MILIKPQSNLSRIKTKYVINTPLANAVVVSDGDVFLFVSSVVRFYVLSVACEIC